MKTSFKGMVKLVLRYIIGCPAIILSIVAVIVMTISHALTMIGMAVIFKITDLIPLYREEFKGTKKWTTKDEIVSSIHDGMTKMIDMWYMFN